MRLRFPAVLGLGLAVMFGTPSHSQSDTASAEVIAPVVNELILPGFATLARESAHLAEVAAQDCTPENPRLRSAYGAAFDAWIAVSHYRFGPTEIDNRVFALSFWPDTRSKTPKALSALLRSEDPSALAPQGYGELSVAAQGFYALEFLLYDSDYQAPAPYACALIRANTVEIARITGDIAQDWQISFGAALLHPGSPDSPYKSDAEAVQELFKALATGLQMAEDMRLSRPLGSFDAPRPKRAEAYRSARSARHLQVSLGTLQDLAQRLASGNRELSASFEGGFASALTALAAVTDPSFGDIEDRMAWFRLDMVRLNVAGLRNEPMILLAEKLGVGSGFNALDGD